MKLCAIKRFNSDSQGNVAMITALAMIPLIGVAGMALDYSMIANRQGYLQQALDASALASAKQLGSNLSSTQLEQFSRDFFFANIPNLDPGKVTFTFDPANSLTGNVIKLSADLEHDTFFGGMFNFSTANITMSSTVKAGNDTLEIALVLDNSGSMNSNNRIGTAKTAAKGLIDQLHGAFSGSNHAEPIRFSIVPFTAHVKVGSNFKNAAWMDKTGISPIHHENLNWAQNPIAVDQGNGTWKDTNGNWLTRFSLFDDINNASWTGCVEARPHPYHTRDTAASTGTPETMYVPVFAPDEPDNYSGDSEQGGIVQIYCKKRKNSNQCKKWNDGYSGNYHSSGAAPNLEWANYYTNKKRKIQGNGTPFGGYDGSTSGNNGNTIWEETYNNDYLDDDHNTPPGMNSHAEGNSGTGSEQNKRQDWSWKYKNQSASVSSFKGPNHGCTGSKITPLTASKSAAKNAINQMGANGYTNVPLGIVWGWRTLSSGAPFTEGRATATPDNNKILIVMTDGNNTQATTSTYNKSIYGAYGLQKNERLFEGFTGLNNPQHTSNHYTKAMDEHMLETCTNAKADGIRVYTVAFDVSNGSSVKTMLQACASVSAITGQPLYFDATGSAALLAAFQTIGTEVSNLRISE